MVRLRSQPFIIPERNPMKANTFHDLLVMEIYDLYDAENQILEALPVMSAKTTSKKLKIGLEKHVKETKEHVKRLEEALQSLGAKLEKKTCKGMKGILDEGKEILKHNLPSQVRDAALLAAAQKVEHYEITVYGTVVTYAKLMKHTKAAQLLKKNMADEERTDKKLTTLAKAEVNKKAMKVNGM